MLLKGRLLEQNYCSYSRLGHGVEYRIQTTIGRKIDKRSPTVTDRKAEGYLWVENVLHSDMSPTTMY